MKANDFISLLEKNGFNFFTGVPCSYFTAMIDIFYKKNHLLHVPAVREDIAVGIAAGASLSKKLPVIYMQNSGLGYSLEAFASIHLIYYIPALVLLSFRGPQDQNMEEHLVMGQLTEETVKSLQLKYSLLENKISDMEIKAIKDLMLKQQQPYFLLITKGALE